MCSHPYILLPPIFTLFSLSLSLFALARTESTETMISFLPPIYCICIYMISIEDNALDRCGEVLTFFLFFLFQKKNS